MVGTVHGFRINCDTLLILQSFNVLTFLPGMYSGRIHCVLRHCNVGHEQTYISPYIHGACWMSDIREWITHSTQWNAFILAERSKCYQEYIASNKQTKHCIRFSQWQYGIKHVMYADPMKIYDFLLLRLNWVTFLFKLMHSFELAMIVCDFGSHSETTDLMTYIYIVHCSSWEYIFGNFFSHIPMTLKDFSLC